MLYFDGAYFKEGTGASIVLISPIDEIFTLMYKIALKLPTI